MGHNCGFSRLHVKSGSLSPCFVSLCPVSAKSPMALLFYYPGKWMGYAQSRWLSIRVSSMTPCFVRGGVLAFALSSFVLQLFSILFLYFSFTFHACFTQFHLPLRRVFSAHC